jgi:NADH-quinone oxidoreductase subunit L
LLFLSAGSVILGMERGHHHLSHQGGKEERGSKSPSSGAHAAHPDRGSRAEPVEVFDPADMRNMGGLRKTMPVTFWLYVIGTLALAGIFPFAGFWSKDEILAASFTQGYTAVYWLLTIAAFFTAFYMGRQIWMVFFGEPHHEAAAKAEESPKVITVPLMVLAALSVIGGALNLPKALVGEGLSEKLSLWLGITISIRPGEFIGSVALFSTGLALLAILLSWYLYGRHPLRTGEQDPLKKFLGPIFTGMEHKWFVDEAYQVLFVDSYVDIAHIIADVIDGRFWHDWFHDKVLVGGYNLLSNIALDRYADQRGIDAFFNGLAQWTKDASASLRRVQNGFVRSYALAVLIGVIAILGYLLSR